LERAKIGEETPRTFKCFVKSFKFNKTVILQGNKQKMPEICGETKVGEGASLFQLAGDSMGNVPIRAPPLFKHAPKCICYFVSIVGKLSNTLWAFPTGWPTPFKYCSNSLQELLGPFPDVQRFGHFFFISLEAVCFCLLK
jgi:hypothetical protein